MTPVRDPRAHAPDLPAALAELVCRMCSIDPATRPIDGQAAADALDALL